VYFSRMVLKGSLQQLCIPQAKSAADPLVKFALGEGHRLKPSWSLGHYICTLREHDNANELGNLIEDALKTDAETAAKMKE